MTQANEAKKDSTKEVAGLEVAEAEFERWAEAMDCDFDTSKMDAEDATAFQKIRRRMLSAIQNGSLVVNTDGEAVYTTQHKRSAHKEAITWKECTGASLMAMDRQKKDHNVAKTFAVMGEICGVHAKTFSGMVGIDAKLCMGIFQLLMD